MKKWGGMWHRADEVAMIDWLKKHGVEVGGRTIYQWKKQQAVLALCKQRGRTRLAVDIGAHVGMWAVNLVEVFAEVVAFEPLPEHVACFKLNTLHAQTRIKLVEVALGDKPGSVAMSRNPGNSGDTWVKGAGSIPMLVLDQMQLAGVDLIKVDCEGFEERVLRGAAMTLRASKPIVIVEQKRDMAAKFGDKPQGAIAFLRWLGYQVVQEIGGDFIMEVPDGHG